jgi:flagellar protein FliO/FliZ
MRATIGVLAACVLLALSAVPQAAAQGKTGQPGAGQGTAAAPADAQKQSESDLLIPEGRQPAEGRAPAAPAVSTWDFVRMFLILAAVVVLIYLLFWVLRRGTGKKIQENEMIRVLGSRGLSGSRALHLVEVGTSVFLVGSSDGGVELISQITDKESLDALRVKAAEQGPANKRSFPEVLSEIFKPARRPFSMGESVEMLRRQRERLRKM